MTISPLLNHNENLLATLFIKVGDRHLNPFDFRRSWTVETEANLQNDLSLSNREIYLEQKLLAIESQFKEFQEQFLYKPKPLGKGISFINNNIIC